MTGLLLGCVSGPKPVPAEARQALAAAAAVDVILEPGSSFVSAQTAKTGAAGLLGPFAQSAAMAIAASEGERMTSEYSLEDPAIRVVDGLASVLRDDLALAQVRVVGHSSGPAHYAEYVLFVKTLNWRMIYYMTNFNRYKVIYQASARLIHATEVQPVWSAVCWVQDEDPGTSPTLAEFEANGGELLRTKLASESDACVAQFRQALLGKSQG